MVLQVALFFVKNSLLDHLLDLQIELTRVKTGCKTHTDACNTAWIVGFQAVLKMGQHTWDNGSIR
ncbi:hypothetical protein SAMN06297422_101145 [Lachnospiraceae bacterium]|nr:hypothetical protein SAMN06297422_101145 [Lachnospiraceae bacterium]